MLSHTFTKFDPTRVPSPCFVVDEVAIEENLKILASVQAASGAKVLAALKAFSMWHLAPLVNQYLSGVCCSGLHEALLGQEFYGGERDVYSAAYKESDLIQLAGFCHHLVFNSVSQLNRFAQHARRSGCSVGLRINPQYSEGEVELYDPCAPGSRLGVPVAEFDPTCLEQINGLHFHTLCEQGSDALERTLAAVEEKFGQYLPAVQWVNFGGGHHITKPDYDRERLIRLIKTFSDKYKVQVYLEPGEAIAIHSGVLVAEVLDISRNQMNIAILDSSATCHMPDTLEMPYRADIYHAGLPGVNAHTYRLGGMSCLAGDVMGDYSFDTPLSIGQRLMFDDMAHYTMVKTTTFNGVPLPALAVWNSNKDTVQVVREFGYPDFKSRLS